MGRGCRDGERLVEDAPIVKVEYREEADGAFLSAVVRVNGSENVFVDLSRFADLAMSGDLSLPHVGELMTVVGTPRANGSILARRVEIG